MIISKAILEPYWLLTTRCNAMPRSSVRSLGARNSAVFADSVAGGIDCAGEEAWGAPEPRGRAVDRGRSRNSIFRAKERTEKFALSSRRVVCGVGRSGSQEASEFGHNARDQGQRQGRRTGCES